MKKNAISTYFKEKRKQEHIRTVEFLRQNPEQALRLQLDNLVLTYGYEAVVQFLTSTSKEVLNGRG